ncbi:putative iron-regulated membrane protein [Mucilaginibacter gracilis]|uniref:Putative iron-regulated membrane protein n=2 Tax=Mucilaginibacter gracilis TaxID=423350 RepID=A0A495IVS3_9SPHI|nr:putative iron-regulated membrane protein [Mucilaginibacter gracilis]
MTAKKVIGFIHLWLGLISGIIVVIVSITGCIMVFEKEIRSVTEPFQYVQTGKVLLPPSQLKKIVEEKSKDKNVGTITYNGPGRSAVVNYMGMKMGSMATNIYVDPYNGQILKIKVMKDDFFRIVLQGHYYLWLPKEIGKVIVPAGVLMFFFLLITGLILWWPKSRKQAGLSFSIRWGAKWKKLNYDLHNVLGFYAMLILLCICTTGLVMGYKWFGQGFYWLTSGGHQLKTAKKPMSKNPVLSDSLNNKADLVWAECLGRKPYVEETAFTFYYPEKKNAAFMVFYNPNKNTHYLRETWYFDQYSLKPLQGKGSGFEAGPYEKAGLGDKIKRMNYDIHTGGILGIWTKVLAFIASLISATLPVTGFYVWWGKRRKKSKATKAATVDREMSLV